MDVQKIGMPREKFLVPSSGSMTQKFFLFFVFIPSSDKMPWPGNFRFILSTRNFSEAKSYFVTTSQNPALCLTSISRRKPSRSIAPAPRARFLMNLSIAILFYHKSRQNTLSSIHNSIITKIPQLRNFGTNNSRKQTKKLSDLLVDLLNNFFSFKKTFKRRFVIQIQTIYFHNSNEMPDAVIACQNLNFAARVKRIYPERAL